MKPEKGKDFVRIWKLYRNIKYNVSNTKNRMRIPKMVKIYKFMSYAQPTVKYAVFEKCQFHNH